jgi:lauroyl/myristoyl acyltransferase
MTVAAHRVAIWLAGNVPPHLAYPVLDRLADLVRLALPGSRQAVERNVAQILAGHGSARGRRHAWALRGVFRHAVRNYYDTFRLPAMSDQDVRDTVVLRGQEHLQAALALGRGAIIVSAHVSSLALTTQALLLLSNTGGTVAVEAVDPPELLDLLVRVRGSHGLRYRALGPGLFGELTATLRQNELVCLLVDRDVGGTGVVLDFFGRPVRLPTGPALLALRTGAPIIPAFVSRRPDGRFDGRINSPIVLPPTHDRRAALTEITGLIARHLEYHIGRYPEQWTVLQDIWMRDGLADHAATASESG